MGLEYHQGYCRTCAQPRKLERKGTNHILHLLLSLVTVGAWVIVWIFLSNVKVGGWACSVCGSEDVSTSIPKVKATPAATAFAEAPVKCPDCAELVMADARKCKHCGATLTPALAPAPATYAPMPTPRTGTSASYRFGKMLARIPPSQFVVIAIAIGLAYFAFGGNR